MLKLSASSIGTYEKCPKQYQYKYIIKPDVPPKDWSFLEFGKCAHRTLELFHEHLLYNVEEPEEYPNLMRKAFKKALSEFDPNILKPEFPELKGVIQDYLDIIKKDGLPPVIHNELSFNFKIEGYTVRGFIDRIDKIGEGEYHVVDYKTNKNPKYLTDFQLLLYALAVKEKYPDAETVHGSYVLLKHKSRTKDWTFTEEDYQRTVDKVLRVGTDITLGEKWEKKPSILCNWCDFYSICQGVWSEDSE
jgi:RecB family exonuclease